MPADAAPLTRAEGSLRNIHRPDRTSIGRPPERSIAVKINTMLSACLLRKIRERPGTGFAGHASCLRVASLSLPPSLLLPAKGHGVRNARKPPQMGEDVILTTTPVGGRIRPPSGDCLVPYRATPETEGRCFDPHEWGPQHDRPCLWSFHGCLGIVLRPRCR